MAGDGVFADDELGCNLAVRSPGGNEPEHFAFAAGEWRGPVRNACVALRIDPHHIGARAELYEHGPGGVELDAGAVVVAEHSAGEPDLHSRPSRVVRHVEIAP